MVNIVQVSVLTGSFGSLVGVLFNFVRTSESCDRYIAILRPFSVLLCRGEWWWLLVVFLNCCACFCNLCIYLVEHEHLLEPHTVHIL